MTGPFDTERQASELPAVQAVYKAFDADPGPGRMAPHTRRMLEAACSAAGVQLGAYDRRILAWLAGWEPQTCAVIAGLISRAHAAGFSRSGPSDDVDLTGDQAAIVVCALADAEKYRMHSAAEFCAVCEAHPAGACDDHLDDVEAAQAYHELAAELAPAGTEEDR